MSKEKLNIIVSLIDSAKEEIEEIETSVERLSYEANTTKNAKVLSSIDNELEALQEDLQENLKELRRLIKEYNKLSKKLK